MTRLGSDFKMKTPTRLLITLKSIPLNSLKVTIPLKELLTQKIPKQKLHLATAMSLFTLLGASTSSALKSRHADQERMTQLVTLTAKDLKLERLAGTVA